MEQDLLVLTLAVFGASTLQSATGIGFGVIAGPVLLISLNDGSAVQISIMLSLLNALLLAPSLRQNADRQLLKTLLIGLAVGSPLGLMLCLHLDVALLKWFAGLVVLSTLFFVTRGTRASSSVQREKSARTEQVSIGVVAGIMGSSLAMPGPVPAAWMSARGFDKDAIRATILAMFVVAYTIALLLQLALAGIGTSAWRLTAILVPSTVAGILVGRVISSRISESASRVVSQCHAGNRDPLQPGSVPRHDLQVDHRTRAPCLALLRALQFLSGAQDVADVSSNGGWSNRHATGRRVDRRVD